jgi:hypothetical protein
MSVIEAASVRIATLADGSLRLTVDVEPTHAQAAFSLFGAPGTPMALAALKVGHAAKSDAIDTTPERVQKSAGNEHVAEKPKGGPLAKLAGIWCADPAFWEWVNSVTRGGIFWHIKDADDAASFVREYCEVDSRAELDHDEAAAERFQRLIRGPYMKHQLATAG